MRRSFLALFCLTMLLAAFGPRPQLAAAQLPPRPAVPRPEPPEPARVSVVVQPVPNLSVAPGSIVTFTIVAANYGKGSAKGATISLPVNPLLLHVLDARFDRPAAWVSRNDADMLEIKTGPLAAGDELQAVVRVQVAAAAPVGASLAQRLSFSWSDRVDGGDGRSNMPGVLVGPASISAELLPLVVAPSADGFSFASDLFAPGEPVGVWYNTPDGETVPLDTVFADADGMLNLELVTGAATAGRYELVVFGHWTELTSVGEFVIP